MRREYSPFELEATTKAINILGNYGRYGWWNGYKDYITATTDYATEVAGYAQRCCNYGNYAQERIVKPKPEPPRDKFEAIIRTAQEELDNSKKKTKITLKRLLFNSTLLVPFSILLFTVATTIFPVWLLAVIAIGFCAAMFCLNKAF